jgi:hypothetical protein
MKKIQTNFFSNLSQYLIPFFRAKKFSKIFWLQLVSWNTIQKNEGTKYGVFRYNDNIRENKF